MVPLWLVLLITVLLLTVFYLLWRLRQCKCGLLEGFETEAETVKTKESFEDAETAKDDEAGKDAAAKPEEDEEPNEAVGTVGTEEDIEPVKTEKPDKSAKPTEAAKDKKKPVEEATTTAAKKLTDQFMNYGEMKIFNSLRDNAYSLNDIKRMIREGEINEKMIEKFLARVEAMEVGSGTPATGSVAPKKPVIEGFAPTGYASAYFN